MTGDQGLRLRDGLRVERVGGEMVVLDGDARRVHRLSGPAADLVEVLLDGADVPFGDEATLRVVGALRAAGIVEGGVTRRRALGTAVAAAGVGIVTLTLPGAAAATTHITGFSGPLTVSGGTEGVPTGSLAAGVTAAEGVQRICRGTAVRGRVAAVRGREDRSTMRVRRPGSVAVAVVPASPRGAATARPAWSSSGT